MTNGEKMLNVFCDSKALELGGNVSFRDGDWAIMFPDEWWHTEYKEPTTKNNLGVDAISRQALLNATVKKSSIWNHITNSEGDNLETIVSKLPSVTPQEPQTFKWCTDCREYDQEKHCCHRWSKVIRNTVEEMKQEQEPVLDKIRAEIETKYGQCKLTEYIVQYDGICTSVNDIGDIADILQILDKYKAESEG